MLRPVRAESTRLNEMNLNKQGTDLARWIQRTLDSLFQPRREFLP